MVGVWLWSGCGGILKGKRWGGGEWHGSSDPHGWVLVNLRNSNKAGQQTFKSINQWTLKPSLLTGIHSFTIPTDEKEKATPANSRSGTTLLPSDISCLNHYISLTPACLLFFAALCTAFSVAEALRLLAASRFFSSSIFLSLFSVLAFPLPFPWNWWERCLNACAHPSDQYISLLLPLPYQWGK